MSPRAADQPLTGSYDCALLDLDGVVYLSGEPLPGAAAAVVEARQRGMRVAFVTNNASRTPEDVAALLTGLGLPAGPDDVVTSAQAAARLLAERLPAGAPVLVVGGAGLQTAVQDVGLRPVDSADDAPAAVVQGYTTDLCYPQLAEATLAVRAGAYWVASNRDWTMPTPRGLVPGNGALVAAVAAASGGTPTFAGKPDPPLHAEAVRRTGARHPLVVGDRLDTDIEGAVRTGTDSLLVMSGVTGVTDLLAAAPSARPTYLAADVSGLLTAHPGVTLTGEQAGCRGWTVDRSAGGVRVTPPAEPADPVDGLRAACALAWAAADAGTPLADLPAAAATVADATGCRR